MDPESGALAEKDFQQAQKELAEGHVLAALACLERALKIWDAPTWYSMLAFCIAKERGHMTKALELCRTAIEHEPDNPAHNYFLGKIHLHAGRKAEALETLREGMNKGGTPEIEELLKIVGMRKPPVIRFLSRDNFLNKHLGKLFTFLGFR